MITSIKNIIMIESDSEHKQSISDSKNFSALANQNSVIKKVLTSKKSFKRNSELKSDLSSWNNIINNDSNKNDELSSDSWAMLIISFKT